MSSAPASNSRHDEDGSAEAEPLQSGAEENQGFASRHGSSRAERKFRPRAFGPWGSKGVNELQFQIKDQEYFLAFVEQEKRWYLFAPTEQGVHRIPVYVDAVKWGPRALLESETLASS